MEVGVNHIRNASYVRDVCIKLWRKENKGTENHRAARKG